MYLWINFILKQIEMFSLQFVGPFKPSFLGLAHFTGLKFCFKLIENYT